MIKTLGKVGIKRTYLNTIKAVYDQPTANVMHNGERLKAFSFTLGTDDNVHFHHIYSI